LLRFSCTTAFCGGIGIEYAMQGSAMKKMILCSSNPLLIKSLYGMLRDAGYAVEPVEHPALAVQRVLSGGYDFAVVDAEPFGLSAEDAARIIRTIAPEMPIFSLGGEEFLNPSMIALPADLEAIKEMLHHSAA
jgi:CheY-like chemotaxis protein